MKRACVIADRFMDKLVESITESDQQSLSNEFLKIVSTRVKEMCQVCQDTVKVEKRRHIRVRHG